MREIDRELEKLTEEAIAGGRGEGSLFAHLDLWGDDTLQKRRDAVTVDFAKWLVDTYKYDLTRDPTTSVKHWRREKR